MHYVVVTTGSCGNCYIFYTGRDTLIIDDGVTFTKLSETMRNHEIPLDTIRALFITHLHPDHSKGVGVLQRRLGVPAYISIVGHVPTFILRGYPDEPATIWRSPNGRIIDVDCGAAFPSRGGRLGCLCLETGEEFYQMEA